MCLSLRYHDLVGRRFDIYPYVRGIGWYSNTVELGDILLNGYLTCLPRLDVRYWLAVYMNVFNLQQVTHYDSTREWWEVL